MDFSLRHIRSFLEVCRTGNLTRAAAALGYSQSSVTGHIKSLESELGTPLFRRHAHGVRLTPAGEIFRGYAHRIVGTVDELAGEIRLRGEASGQIRVGAVPLLIGSLENGLMNECQYRYPRVHVSPRVVGAAEIRAVVVAGGLDLGLLLLDRPGDTAAESTTKGRGLVPAGRAGDTSGAVITRLCRVDLVPVGGQRFAGATSARERLPRGTRIVVVGADCPSQQRLPRVLHSRDGVAPPLWEVTSVASARQYVATGLGIAMLPYEPAFEQGTPDGLTVLRGLPVARMHAGLVLPSMGWLSSAAAAFADLVDRHGRKELERSAGGGPAITEADHGGPGSHPSSAQSSELRPSSVMQRPAHCDAGASAGPHVLAPPLRAAGYRS
ncbi:LysR family transcriptional regulator [Streptomyces kunmingensis]|uniref:LysR family transcriptional regulator n=1 Tax=Streptomyces kunmingensis TaxID=68225 RepID=A0ABU6C923_9ACTN|nr:LysR family transcriptional regulator [Streptomyces kunmingensis]MEB3961210.1 LysR family transcriptional regulator [Streptomyces kunmingensis]